MGLLCENYISSFRIIKHPHIYSPSSKKHQIPYCQILQSPNRRFNEWVQIESVLLDAHDALCKKTLLIVDDAIQQHPHDQRVEGGGVGDTPSRQHPHES